MHVFVITSVLHLSSIHLCPIYIYIYNLIFFHSCLCTLRIGLLLVIHAGVYVQHWNHPVRLYRRQSNSKIFIWIHQHDRNHCIPNRRRTKQPPNAGRMFAYCPIARAVARIFQVIEFFSIRGTWDVGAFGGRGGTRALGQHRMYRKSADCRRTNGSSRPNTSCRRSSRWSKY